MNKHQWLVSVFAVCLLLSLTATLAMAQGPNPPSGGNPNPPGGGKPITAVKAGTGLMGGGTSGDVTLAITPTYRLPQACTNGQVPKWNGSAWTCANDGFSLPFTGSVNSSGDAFSITNTGTGRTAVFQTDNTTNLTYTVSIYTNGKNTAFNAVNRGDGGRAGRFEISNTANTSPTVSIYDGGGGDALEVGAYGTGRAARFTINNPTNMTNTIFAITNGGGNTINARNSGTGSTGYFNIDNPANSSTVFTAETNGTGGAGSFRITNPTNNAQALRVQTSGLNTAGYFVIDNPDNPWYAIFARTSGTGRAATFMISNTVNTNNTLVAFTEGLGRAGVFGINNPANDREALSVNTSGTGWTGSFTTNSGKGVYISVPPGNEGLNVASGTKNAVVATNNGARLLYTEESSQVWFTDYGFGRLQNGRATIAIDLLFSQTINLDEPYHVFVQAYGDAELYVTNRTRTSFEVRTRDGDPAVEFSYRLVAKRFGFEDKRLEHATWADSDPNLYPGK